MRMCSVKNPRGKHENWIIRSLSLPLTLSLARSLYWEVKRRQVDKAIFFRDFCVCSLVQPVRFFMETNKIRVRFVCSKWNFKLPRRERANYTQTTTRIFKSLLATVWTCVVCALLWLFVKYFNFDWVNFVRCSWNVIVAHFLSVPHFQSASWARVCLAHAARTSYSRRPVHLLRP